MNNIKSVFSVKDLENLSGIKAHTIRIWEKRYAIFSPYRNENNVRSYNSDDLKKILNISFLNKFGYKISKIAQLSESEIKILVKQIYSETTIATYSISNFKLAMFNFDSKLFHSTYDELLKVKSFEAIFYEIFIPLLEEIGFLWQTETLKPIHEHFISSLIRQKLFSEIEIAQKMNDLNTDQVFVLFLPLHEIHEIGITFINYLLLKHGKQVVYLGENVPSDDLKELHNHFYNITFISYFTVQPEQDNLNDYLENFYNSVLVNTSSKFWILGRQTQYVSTDYSNIKTFSSIQDMLMEL